MKAPASDAVFRALADPSRRRMLDLLKARPGLTVGELGEHFEFSRFAVMKHLRILERNQLVVPTREGKTKRLYLNAVPIQTIYDRWISKYSALWASQLTSLKYELEGEDRPMPAAVAQLQHIHVVHIRTTPEKLWSALTRSELTRQYYYGCDVVSDWKPGSKIEYRRSKDGKIESMVTGEVLEVTPLRRLVHTFSFPSTGDEPTKVTYELEPIGEMVKVTMTHEGFAGETKTYQMISTGWVPLFDGLKSLLETGKALDFPPM
jgi:uncharacterized protein YndB with AHSA1/START domain/DNA-binding transcriptional ArsR family regulator